MLAVYYLLAVTGTIVTGAILVLAWAWWLDGHPHHPAAHRRSVAMTAPAAADRDFNPFGYATAAATADIKARLDFHHDDALTDLAAGRRDADVLQDLLYAIRHLSATLTPTGEAS